MRVRPALLSLQDLPFARKLLTAVHLQWVRLGIGLVRRASPSAGSLASCNEQTGTDVLATVENIVGRDVDQDKVVLLRQFGQVSGDGGVDLS